jgi:hypothetical protein
MKTKFFFLALIFLLTLNTIIAQSIQGTYAIKNIETGKLLRIQDANREDLTPLVLYSPVNWKCMTWDFQFVSNETYQLRNLFTNKTFSTLDKFPKAGSELKQFPIDKNNKLQNWEFIKQDKDNYLIRLSGTELYLTPSDPKGTSNSPIILSEKSGAKLQLWTIYKQNPTM